MRARHLPRLVFHLLLERERLGTTGVGHGIAPDALETGASFLVNAFRESRKAV